MIEIKDSAWLRTQLAGLCLEELEQTTVDKWLSHLLLLLKWNKAYNLTAIKEPRQMLTQHLLDSLSIHSHIDVGPVLDVGSGGGFPGIPLAILKPRMQFILVDASNKKVQFLKHAVMDLGLDNVTALHGRIEDLSIPVKPAIIVSRAFSSLINFVELTATHLDANNRLLAMKGKLPREELAALSDELTYTVSSIQVPELNAERHLVSISRKP